MFNIYAYYIYLCLGSDFCLLPLLLGGDGRAVLPLGTGFPFGLID
jgi:hypothetical protein